jgi:DNA-binding MarR family transcriptional regulator
MTQEIAFHSRSAQTAAAGPDRLRSLVQQFTRSFGLLAAEQTPCGMPLSTSHAHALLVLLESARADMPVTQQELGMALGIDKSNVTRLCAKIERTGHLTQTRSPVDGRARVLALTTKGRRLAERVESSSRGRFAELLAALPARSRANVMNSLETLNGAIRALRAAESHS